MLATKIRWCERMVGAAIIARKYRQKTKYLLRQLPIVEEPGLKAAIGKRFDGYSCDLWHKVYAAASGRSSVDYMPEDIFYNIFQSRLNPRHRREAYKDKNYFDRLDWPLPQTIFRIIDGRLFDKSYRMIDAETALALARDTELSEFVVKPARESGGGNRVAFLDLPALTSFLPANMKRHSDWIVQHPIRQHETMASLNASSVNTIRIITIRIGAKVSVVSCFVRIGIGGKRVDNISVGGVAIGIEQDGRLMKCGYMDESYILRRHTTHPEQGYSFDSLVIPSFAAAQQTCIVVHQGVPDLDLLSWDVAIDHQGVPIVIEVNMGRQDINISQICNGPVFRPYIDAVLGRHEWFVTPGIGAIDQQADIAPEFVRH